jgi:hypothetical protein
MATMLRPMNIGELLDRIFFLYRKNFIVLVGIVAIPQLFLLVFHLAEISMIASSSLRSTIYWTVLEILFYLATVPVSQAATMIAVSEIHLGREATIGKSFLGSKECVYKIIVIMILSGLGVILGLLLLIVPGIILGLAWSMAVPIAVIEKMRPVAAMSRSVRLTKDSRFRIFVITIIVAVFVYIGSIIFQIPVAIFEIPALLQRRSIPAWVSVLSVVGSFFSSSLVLPIGTVATALIYYDLRVRKEGFDLQFMMSSMKDSGQQPPGTQANPQQP